MATTTSLPPPKIRNKNLGAIVGGTMGGVAAILAVIGIVTFEQRRRRLRQSRPRSILSLSNDPMYASPQMIGTPFDPTRNSSEATQDSVISAEQQSSVLGDPETEMVALHRRSFSLCAVSPLFPPEGSVPVGLSGKELARLRAEAPSSPLPDNVRVSRSNPSLSTSSPTVVTESGGLTTLLHHTRRLHLDVESLRYEMEHRLLEINRIHAEGFESGAQSIDTSRDE
jgi:hypothetical protein